MKARKRAKTNVSLPDPASVAARESAEHLRTLTPFQLAAIAASLSRPGNKHPGDLVRQAYDLWQEATKFLESEDERHQAHRRFEERLSGAPIPFTDLIRNNRIPTRGRRFWNSHTRACIRSIPNLCDAISTWFDHRVDCIRREPKDESEADAEVNTRIKRLEDWKAEILKTKEILPDTLQGFIDFQNRIFPASLDDFLKQVIKATTPADATKRLRDYFRSRCPDGTDSLKFAEDQIKKIKCEGFPAENPTTWDELAHSYSEWWKNRVAEQNRKNRQSASKNSDTPEKK